MDQYDRDQISRQNARNLADTASSARSTANAAWTNAGFGAVNTFQNARLIAEQQEQSQIMQDAANQQDVHNFAMWIEQTESGKAFFAWRKNAASLVRRIYDRDSLWKQAWARHIGRAQSETPEDQKSRYQKHPRKLRQTGLLIGAVVMFIFAAFAGLNLAFESAAMSGSRASARASYENCLKNLDAPDNLLFDEALCESVNPGNPVLNATIWVVVWLTIAVGLLILRFFRKRAARTDQTVPNEAQARIDYWGFDPLAVHPGFYLFYWSPNLRATDYADRVKQFAIDGYRGHPHKSTLIKLDMPPAHPSRSDFAPEINEMLEWFAAN